MRKKTQLFILQWHSQNTKCKCSKAASGRWHHIFIYHAACAPSHFKLNIRYVCMYNIYIYDYICTQTATSDTWVSCLNTPPMHCSSASTQTYEHWDEQLRGSWTVSFEQPHCSSRKSASLCGSCTNRYRSVCSSSNLNAVPIKCVHVSHIITHV